MARILGYSRHIGFYHHSHYIPFKTLEIIAAMVILKVALKDSIQTQITWITDYFRTVDMVHICDKVFILPNTL